MRIDQYIFRNLVYLPVTIARGQPVLRRLEQLHRLERIAPRERRQLQEQRLTHLVEIARQTTLEYAHRLSSVPHRPLTLDDLSYIPTLSKQELRASREGILATPASPFCVEKTTGGSTGEPVTIRKTRDAMAWELAATWRGYSWANVHIGDRQARFWGVPISLTGRSQARLTDFICHRRRFSAFDFDRDRFAAYERELRAYAPDYLYGYASMLAEFARWLLESGQRLPVAPKAIITTSEVLAPDDRSAIETAFESRVFNEYGSGELGTVAHECEYGQLHLSDENMVVEILDGDRPCLPNEKGEIVVTELNNIAMPLIRYRTGDFGAKSDASCPCGRTLGTLASVYGRAYDFIVAPDGRRFHAEFLMYIFEEAQRQNVGISQFQVRQVEPNLLNVSIVQAIGGFSPGQEARLGGRIRELLGADVQVQFTIVDRIPREPSGKMRIIVGLDSEQSSRISLASAATSSS